MPSSSSHSLYTSFFKQRGPYLTSFLSYYSAFSLYFLFHLSSSSSFSLLLKRSVSFNFFSFFYSFSWNIIKKIIWVELETGMPKLFLVSSFVNLLKFAPFFDSVIKMMCSVVGKSYKVVCFFFFLVYWIVFACLNKNLY